MRSEPTRLDQAMARIDAANAADPNHAVVAGQSIAKELLYSQRMSAWLERLAPGAPEPLRLAVRAQHICRWRVPRSSYPMDRNGYKRWRSGLARMHADLAAEILQEVGYEAEMIARVRDLVQKKRLRSDPQAQALEDVACLVFLEHYFADFVAGKDEGKVIDIVQKTWKKMSPRARELALTLELTTPVRLLLEKALFAPRS